MSFINIPALLIVIGGTPGATLASTKFSMVGTMVKASRSPSPGRSFDLRDALERMVGLAERARRDGLLALEDDISELPDAFSQKGVQLIVDGADSELVKSILDAETDGMVARHAPGREDLRDRRRLRADPGDPRHGHEPRARAREPRLARLARPLDRRRVHRDALRRRQREPDLPADLEQAQGALRRRAPVPRDADRGDPLDPGRRQPAPAPGEARDLPRSDDAERRGRRARRRGSGHQRPSPRSPRYEQARGARGTRRRDGALAPDLRRHDHAAPGAVHRALVHLLGEHLEVQRAEAVAARRPERQDRHGLAVHPDRWPEPAEPARHAGADDRAAEPEHQGVDHLGDLAGAPEAGSGQPGARPAADPGSTRSRTGSPGRSGRRSTSAAWSCGSSPTTCSSTPARRR